ncbi:MAG: type II toxin-antitoxin system HicB family antitoxin [Planctomycetaceae bacterium]
MTTTRIVYWEESDGRWVGYLEQYPDYHTQGDTLDDLRMHLRDLYDDLSGGLIPGARKIEDLVVSP